MTTSTQRDPTGERPAPEETLAALRAAGPAAVAELLGDVDFLLTAISTAPGSMLEPAQQPRGEYKNLLDRVHGVRGALDALEARTVVAFAEATRREHIAAVRDGLAHEDALLPPLERLLHQADATTSRDYSLATRRSPSAAGSSLVTARRLVRSMPRMLDALAHGKVTASVAHAAASTLHPLDDQQRRQVDAMLHERLPLMDGAGVRRWRAAVGQAVDELDPHGAARRHRISRRGRHLGFTRGEHGMATVSAHLPALEAKLVHKRLGLEAERRRAEGAREGHAALMADAFVDALLGRETQREPVTLEIGVMITERSLLSPEHGDPAHIEGYGPVPAASLREAIRAALADPESPDRDPCGPQGPEIRTMIRRLFLHPTSGELVAVESRSREFPAAMKRFLAWRDVTCRAPYCDAPVRQHDHIVPVSLGGATSLDNGQALCAFCNTHKEEDTARIERVEHVEGPTPDAAPAESPGHLVSWTGHGGTVVVTAPPRLGPVTPGADPQGLTSPRPG